MLETSALPLEELDVQACWEDVVDMDGTLLCEPLQAVPMNPGEPFDILYCLPDDTSDEPNCFALDNTALPQVELDVQACWEDVVDQDGTLLCDPLTAQPFHPDQTLDILYCIDSDTSDEPECFELETSALPQQPLDVLVCWDDPADPDADPACAPAQGAPVNPDEPLDILYCLPDDTSDELNCFELETSALPQQPLDVLGCWDDPADPDAAAACAPLTAQPFQPTEPLDILYCVRSEVSGELECVEFTAGTREHILLARIVP